MLCAMFVMFHVGDYCMDRKMLCMSGSVYNLRYYVVKMLGIYFISKLENGSVILLIL